MNMTRNIRWSRQMKVFVTSRLYCSKFMDMRNIQTSTANVLIHGNIRKEVSYPLQRQTYSMNNGHITTACEDNLDTLLFEKVCSETLESLTAYFEELVETKQKLANAEVSYSDGVLTINLGKHGTYVINRQSPNKQIWLSSPVSGPKRYDFIVRNGCWVYKRDSRTLHHLLQSEISVILGEDIHMTECAYSKSENY